jgi:hypothetical protein
MAGRWETACFPDVPADVGSSCRAPNGELRAALCLTNTCADLGALGLCSASCATEPCPPGTACADLNDRRRLCLRPCGPDFACASDPLLGCVPPDGMGASGFSVRDGPDGATYCAPRRCQIDADCGPAGQCQEDPQAPSCVRRM